MTSLGSVVARRRAARGRQRGQSLIEFSMIITVIMLMLLGMVEFGFIFDHHLTLEYATREGARVGAAMANGGGPITPGCSAETTSSAKVDPLVVAAVQRVITSPGSAVVPSRISEIRIYKSNASGQPIAPGIANVYVYNAGGGPVVDGKALDFKLSAAGTGWTACSRDNGGTADSLGVSLIYNYQLVTPLSAAMSFFGGGMSSVTISDRTIMALNPGS